MHWNQRKRRLLIGVVPFLLLIALVQGTKPLIYSYQKLSIKRNLPNRPQHELLESLWESAKRRVAESEGSLTMSQAVALEYGVRPEWMNPFDVRLEVGEDMFVLDTDTGIMRNRVLSEAFRGFSRTVHDYLERGFFTQRPVVLLTLVRSYRKGPGMGLHELLHHVYLILTPEQKREFQKIFETAYEVYHQHPTAADSFFEIYTRDVLGIESPKNEVQREAAWSELFTRVGGIILGYPLVSSQLPERYVAIFRDFFERYIMLPSMPINDEAKPPLTETRSLKSIVAAL